MKNISYTGLALALLCAMSPSAFAVTYEPENGFLDQEKPDWIEALPVLESLFPTIIQEVRAANLQVHEEVDRLHINSPTYEQAHRLLLQHLLMMERQLSFNAVDLARFNSSDHLPRFTVDSRNYPRGNADGSAVSTRPVPVVVISTPIPPAFVVTGGVSRPSRRSIIAIAEETNGQRVEALQN